MIPFDLIRSGLVRRWHMNPDMAHSGETNAQHQWMVVSLILALNPQASRALLIEALWHDVGELRAGDLSAPFKRENPAIAMDHAVFEFQARREICGSFDLTAQETLWLKMVDQLAAYLWMLIRAPHLAQRLDWMGDHDRVVSIADALGVKAAVKELIGWFAAGGSPPQPDLRHCITPMPAMAGGGNNA